MEPKVIPLKFPVEMIATNGAKSMLAEVTVRRAKAKDLKHVPDGAFTDDPKVATMAMYCGIPYETAEEIDIEDTYTIMRAIQETEPSLTSASSGTGEKSSGGSPEPTTSLLE